MLRLVGTKSEKLDLVITLLLLFGICLHYWGIVANMVVIAANDNAMPVMIESNMVLIPEQDGFKRTTEPGNLMLLSDRIRIDFPFIEDKIPAGKLGSVIGWWAKYLNYPVEGGLKMVSIGDLMRWVGSLILISFVPVVVLLVSRRIFLTLRANRVLQNRIIMR